MQTDFYEDRLRVFLEEFKKIPWLTAKKSKAFYISRANIKSVTNCPLLMRALRALKKMTAGAENMMHTHGFIKTDCSERTDRQKSRAYRLHSA